MKEIDFDYLRSVSKLFPADVRWGVGFDGQRLGIVGYAMVQDGHKKQKRNPSVFEPLLRPMVFYAVEMSDVSIRRSLMVFDTIASSTGLRSLNLLTEGEGGAADVFTTQIRKTTNHKVRQFKSTGQGRYFSVEQVVISVRDDMVDGQIKLAPEFEARPERVLLDEELAVTEPGKRLTVLQAAYSFGLGFWSCLDQRKPFAVGGSSFRVY